MNRKIIYSMIIAIFMLGMIGNSTVSAYTSISARGKPVKDSLVVTIETPADGATVEGNVLITVSVVDPQGIYNNLVADISIDGVLVANANSYTWATTQDLNGNHEIKAYAEQPKSRGKPVKVISDEDTISITVDNYVEPPPSGDGDDWFYGVVGYGDSQWQYIDAGIGTINAELSWGNSYDVDMYLYRPSDYSNYVVRAYTTANPETMTYEADECGMWAVEVRMYTSNGYNTNYELHVTYTPNTPDTTAPVCTITDPVNNDVVYKTKYIKVTATDDRAVDYVDFFIDGALIGTDSSAPFSYPWDTTAYANSAYTISAIAYDGAGNSDASAQVTVTVDQSAAPLVDVQKYAVIAGVSDYKAISDLSYCDEDATDWYNFLTGALGFLPDNVVVLGDTHSNNYPKYDGLATEANTKAALNDMISSADEDDIIVFVTSGHGSGDGRGSSYLCSWDCGSGESGEDGDFYDYELADILGTAIAGSIYVNIDHCYSGGMGPELMALGNAANIICHTTCTDNGYGWDDPDSQNGLWTHWFLEESWISQFGSDPNIDVESVFSWALANYPKGGGDTPEEYDGSAEPMVLN